MAINEDLLPGDLVSEILSRLPIKSLLQFKSVSKSWRTLIDDPRFRTKHFKSPTNPELILISYFYLESNRQVLSSLSCGTLEMVQKHVEFDYVEIIGPCNGVLCLFNGKDRIAIWNPATKELRALSSSPINPPEYTLQLGVRVGFGFDLETNDYKVIVYKHMCFRSSTTFSHAELYTFSTSKWKQIDVRDEFQPTGILLGPASTTSINGISSWFEKDNHAEMVILSFDMRKEMFTKTELPDYGVPSKRVHGFLASLKDSLSFIHDYPIKGLSKSFDVWILGQYGCRESWCKMLCVGPLDRVKKALAFWKDSDILLENYNEELVSYDLITQEMLSLQVSRFQQVLVYRESLAHVS